MWPPLPVFLLLAHLVLVQPIVALVLMVVVVKAVWQLVASAAKVSASHPSHSRLACGRAGCDGGCG